MLNVNIIIFVFFFFCFFFSSLNVMMLLLLVESFILICLMYFIIFNYSWFSTIMFILISVCVSAYGVSLLVSNSRSKVFTFFFFF